MYTSNIAYKSQLEARELLLLEQEVKAQAKNMILGYVLWYFLGIFGGHRFYMQRTGSAIAQLILTITVIGIFVSFIWWIIDAFLLHQWIKDNNREVETRILHDILSNKDFNSAMNRPL